MSFAFWGYVPPPPPPRKVSDCLNCGWHMTILFNTVEGILYRHCLKCGVDALAVKGRTI